MSTGGPSCLASVFPPKMGPPGALQACRGGRQVTEAARDAHFSTQRPGLGIVCFLRPLQATEWGYLWGSDLIFP